MTSRSVTLALVAAALTPATAAARPSADTLSPRLAALVTPHLRAASASTQDHAVGLPSEGPGALQRRATALVAQVRLDDTSGARVDELRDAGIDVVHVDDGLDTATVTATPQALARLRSLPGVRGAHEVLAPVVRGAGDNTADAPVTRATACTPVISDGDTQLKAATARSANNVDGTGVTVGVLSDSYDKSGVGSASADVKSGDLPGDGNPCGHPTAVNVVHEDPDSTDATDEGRAMLQIVHDIAPGAKLAFSTADPDDLTFADNIVDVANAGAKVLVDDVSYLNEPFFQDGPIAEAVTAVTGSGRAYFSAAGNENRLDGSGSYEAAAYRPTDCPLTVKALATDCMNFNPGSGAADNGFDFTLPAGTSPDAMFDLQWAEPWDGVTTDLDLYVLDKTSGAIVASSDADNLSDDLQEPFEVADLKLSGSYRLVIARAQGTGTPRVKFIELGSDITNVQPTVAPDVAGPTVFGHEGQKDAMSVGAVYDMDSSKPETYSSRGPLTTYFEPVHGADLQPAAALTTPQVTVKPDIGATDCNQTTFFYGSSHTFCGTSAAAPHAAGVAALQYQRGVKATFQQIRDAQTSTATALAGYGFGVGVPDVGVGAGLLDASRAVPATPASSADAPATTTSTPVPAPAAPAATPMTTTAPKPVTPRPILVSKPTTKLGSHPARRTRSRSARFTFRSSVRGATFQCRVGRAKFTACKSPKRVRVAPGRRSFSVRAIGPGNAVGKSVTFRWTVVRTKTARGPRGRPLT